MKEKKRKTYKKKKEGKIDPKKEKLEQKKI